MSLFPLPCLTLNGPLGLLIVRFEEHLLMFVLRLTIRPATVYF